MLCNTYNSLIWPITVNDDMNLPHYFVGHTEPSPHLISLEILVTQLSAGMWLSAGDQCI